MKAFHGNQELKEKIISQLKAHYKADEIIKGTYWEGGKGCAVGCTIHSSKHSDYEKILGIPAQLAGLEDTIFENLTNKEAKEFPLKFIKAIPVGVDLTNIYSKWSIITLKRTKKRVNVKFDYVINAIDNVIALHKKAIDGTVELKDWDNVILAAARSASEAARSASSSASEAARSASSSAAAARSASEAAWSGSEAARSARSASEAARSASEAAWSGSSSAAEAEFKKQKNDLLRLLKSAGK